MKKLILSVLFFASHAHSQVDAKGEWQFPTSIRTLCIETEQTIVGDFKNMVVQNRLMEASKESEKRAYYEQMQGWKDLKIQHEQSWERLGCASILYPKK